MDITNLLDPVIYDLEESRGRTFLTNRMIEAFAPAAFFATSYPTHITRTEELWRYVDVMHEHQGDHTLDFILEGLTADEFDLFKRAVEFMFEFTKANFFAPIRCENALLRALNAYRHIKSFNPNVVFELGPGSGYLGLLLILDGIGYIACDNTQALYLIQNRIWQAAAGDNFIELAVRDESMRDILKSDLSGKVVHIPWWKVIDLDLTTLPGRIDVFTANHCLAEMQPTALKYFLRLSYAFLNESKGGFIFEGWGADHLRPSWDVCSQFVQDDYRLCHADEKITIFATAKSISKGYKTLPQTDSVVSKVRNIFRRCCGLPPWRLGFKTTETFSGENYFSIMIMNLRSKIHNAKFYKTIEVMNFVNLIYQDKKDYEQRFLLLIKDKPLGQSK